MRSRDSTGRAHYACERCKWQLIVADNGIIFEGADASERYLSWLNEPYSDSAVATTKRIAAHSSKNRLVQMLLPSRISM